MFDMFKEWYDNRHEYARYWKDKHGGKVLGYFCTYVPEEILYAAGVLPVRILGSHEPQDVTEPHIFGMFCPFCRDCLAQGLKGRFDYLDGIMEAQSCLHLRQAFTSWKLHLPVGFAYYLPFPHGVQSPRAYAYLAEELATFKKAVEDWTGVTITEEALDHAIDVYNTNRRLIRQVYEARKSDNPPLTGLEAMYMVVSSQMVDKAEHNRILEEIVARLPERRPDSDGGVRLLMVGSENDDVEFVEMVESLGATVVVDEHCTGSRYWWNEVEPQDDRLMAIAARYIDRPACPSKDWPEWTRIPHVVELAHDYRVDGAILLQQKFCDPHEFDIPVIGQRLQEQGIPTYFLELDATLPVGQFKTRVEAFLEMLREEDLFDEDLY